MSAVNIFLIGMSVGFCIALGWVLCYWWHGLAELFSKK